MKIPLRQALDKFFFYEGAPNRYDLILQQFKGKWSLQEFCSRSKLNRFAVHRWLKGESEPTVTQMFDIFNLLTPRLPEFLRFIGGDELASPSSQNASKSLLNLYYEFPWLEGLTKVFDLKKICGPTTEELRFIQDRISLPIPKIREGLELLAAAQVLKKDNGYWQMDREDLYTNSDSKGFRLIRIYWLERILKLLTNGKRKGHEKFDKSLIGQSVFSVNEDQFDRIRAKVGDLLKEIRNIVQEENSDETIVAMFSAQFVNLKVLPD